MIQRATQRTPLPVSLKMGFAPIGSTPPYRNGEGSATVEFAGLLAEFGWRDASLPQCFGGDLEGVGLPNLDKPAHRPF